LSFIDVPDNILPNPPVSLWVDLNISANRLFRKILRQSDRQKTILGVMRGSKQDGETIVNADDGEAVILDHPDRCREYKFGGADNVGLAFSMHLKEMFSYFSGNLDSLGGLGARSDTVGQDKLLQSSASEQINNMKDRVVNFASDVIKDIAWYIAYDPLIQIPLNKRIEGTDISIPIVLTSDELEGTYLEYNFEIVPYSMEDNSPAIKLQKFGAVFNNFIAPMIPLIQAQGGQLDTQKYTSTLSRWANLPELSDMFTFADGGGQQAQPPTGAPPSKFSHTINERVNRPGATIPGKSAAAMQSLLAGAGGVQPAQAESMQRSVA
jgi:hypothetical protein